MKTAVLLKGATFTGDYYALLLNKLTEAIKIKRRCIISKVILNLQAKVLVHNAHVAMPEAWACGYEILPHSRYCFDLALSECHLFQPMKLFLKGKRLSDDKALISKVTSWLEDQRGVL